jgi:hypothetical protein
MLRSMFIRFITTGGTIDKIYFDALSQFEVGESQVEHILKEGLVQFDYEIVSLLPAQLRGERRREPLCNNPRYGHDGRDGRGIAGPG